MLPNVGHHELATFGWLRIATLGFRACPEGPHIQLLRNQAPKYNTLEGILGPLSLMVVHVDLLG